MKRMYLLILGLPLTISLMAAGCGTKDSSERVALETQIAPVKYNRDAMVTITSDDGRFETGIMLDELGGKYNFKITVSGIVKFIEPHLKEWQKIEKKGNVELISHSYTHLKMDPAEEFSNDVLEYEITESIEFFKKNFQTDQIAFTPPENQICEEGYVLLANNEIRVMRQGSRGYNTLMPEDGCALSQWYNLYTVGIGDVNTTAERNVWIDEAIASQAWLIEMWHDVSLDGNTGYYQEISYAMADEHLSYIADRQTDGEIWVASLVDASKYLLEKEYATVEAYYCNSKIEVSLTCDQEEVPANIYGEALTVRVLLPEEARDFTQAVSSDKKNEVRMSEEGGEIWLEFEMIPNKGNITIRLK